VEKGLTQLSGVLEQPTEYVAGGFQKGIETEKSGKPHVEGGRDGLSEIELSTI